MEYIIFYIVLGAVAGTLAGLLGVGGGLVIVPVLAYVFTLQSMPADIVMHLALGTSLASIVMTSISSSYAHHKHGAVLWTVFASLSPGIVIGAWLGAAIVDQLPTLTLRRIFGVFEWIVAAQIAFNLLPQAYRDLPGMLGRSIAGIVIGTVSAIVGIGGGTLTVPFLVVCRVAMRNAVATSAACGLPIAVAGMSGYIVTGWGNTNLPAWSTGYVYWPALLAIISASMLFAPVGAKLAHTLPVAMLKKIFALLLFVLGLMMFLTS